MIQHTKNIFYFFLIVFSTASMAALPLCNELKAQAKYAKYTVSPGTSSCSSGSGVACMSNEGQSILCPPNTPAPTKNIRYIYCQCDPKKKNTQNILINSCDQNISGQCQRLINMCGKGWCKSQIGKKKSRYGINKAIPHDCPTQHPCW